MIAKTVGTAIVGAGPYGLSIAAHLRARGIQHRIFGRPMVTWLNHMPKSMLLKSDGFASNLSAPAGDHTLRSYCLSHGISYDDYDIPVALTTFTDYALDFQRRFVPEVDERLLTELASRDGGFTLRLEGGERLHAHRVVLAVGISHFDHVPEGLKEHAGRFVSHSSAWKEVSQFLNSDVTIIGGGSSALELAAALHEAGAKARLVIRAPAIRFDSRTPRPSALGLWRRLRHPRSGLGPNLKSWLYSEYPHLFRYLPPSTRLDILHRHLGPASPGYLRSALQKVDLLMGYEIDGATIRENRVHLSVTKGSEKSLALSTDHVIAATGYRVDVQRLHFMDASLRGRIRTIGQTPILSRNLESNVPRLYFAGLAAAGSFGPLLRFVHGTEFAARRIAAHIARGGGA